MPKSSRAFAASFMISRSESEPMTMETNGLSGMSSYSLTSRLYSLFQSTCANVAAVIHVLKMDAVHGLIGSGDGGLQRGCARGNAEHSSATRVNFAVTPAGSRMKHLHIVQLRRS